MVWVNELDRQLLAALLSLGSVTASGLASEASSEELATRRWLRAARSRNLVASISNDRREEWSITNRGQIVLGDLQALDALDT